LLLPKPLPLMKPQNNNDASLQLILRKHLLDEKEMQ